MADGQVLIAYVHDGEYASMSWHESMMEFAFNFAQSDHFGAKLPIRYGTGGLVQARNKAVDILLAQDDCDWLFWIDTDMGFQADIVDRLMEAADPVERPVVGALCFINHEVIDDGMHGKVTVPKPTIFQWAKNPDGKTGFVPNMGYERDTLVRCDATGSAALVIHRSVFERIREHNGGNYYGHIASPGTDEVFSEDMSFCIRCVEVDAPIHVHTGVKTTHCKLRWLGETEFDRAMMAHTLEKSMGQEGLTVPNKAPKARNRAERRAAAKNRS